MGKPAWFRHTDWTADIEAAFFQRLRRARDKAQYLRIQASYLTTSDPRVALRLLDEYFLVPERSKLLDPQAHVDKAHALVSLNNIEGALAAYASALDLEAQDAKVKTQAYLCLAVLVATKRQVSWYERAIDVLDAHRDDMAFPIDRYLANGARALLLHEFGQVEEARSFASLALQAATETTSGFRHHQHLGLVGRTDDEFGKRLKMLAAVARRDSTT
jgi:hypothetical protein